MIISDDICEDLLQRLMKENLWDREYTERVMTEYGKFIYLTLQAPVAPSFEVDQVWHAHMLYSKDYLGMCRRLGKEYIHHNPVIKFNKNIGEKKDEYQDTLTLYKKYFGEPPRDIWTQFEPSHHAYIDLNKHWVMPAGDLRALLKVLFTYLLKR